VRTAIRLEPDRPKSAAANTLASSVVAVDESAVSRAAIPPNLSSSVTNRGRAPNLGIHQNFNEFIEALAKTEGFDGGRFTAHFN